MVKTEDHEQPAAEGKVDKTIKKEKKKKDKKDKKKKDKKKDKSPDKKKIKEEPVQPYYYDNGDEAELEAERVKKEAEEAAAKQKAEEAKQKAEEEKKKAERKKKKFEKAKRCHDAINEVRKYVEYYAGLFQNLEEGLESLMEVIVEEEDDSNYMSLLDPENFTGDFTDCMGNIKDMMPKLVEARNRKLPFTKGMLKFMEMYKRALEKSKTDTSPHDELKRAMQEYDSTFYMQ